MRLSGRGSGLARLVALMLVLAGGARVSRADILPSQVLVVFNSASAEGTALKNAYMAAHPGIPAVNVVDLNSPVLLTLPEVAYATFINLIRNPIRNYLAQPGLPDADSIIAIVLIRPIPHRIQDNTNAPVGDTPSNALNEFLAGDATFASVDSELTLLWQNLETGEAGGSMDSRSDNAITNPYFKSMVGIDGFSRVNITAQRTLTPVAGVAWFTSGSGMTPGDMYIVSRIDGNTLADASAALGRAQGLYVNRAVTKVLLDAYNTSVRAPIDDDNLFNPPSADPFWGGPDYADTTMALSMNGWNVRYDQTFAFITPALEPNLLIAYGSYGGNHSLGGAGEVPPGGANYIVGFRFPNGAIFNTIESYNARGFNGQGTLFNQCQIATFLAAGGTFGVGNVWEPISPFVPDNEFLLQNFLVNGLTWGEAAWSSIPALSWQELAVGDPLAKANVIYDPGLPRGDMDGNGRVDGEDVRWFEAVLDGRIAEYRAAFPALDPRARGDFNGDYAVTATDVGGMITALLGP